MEDFSGALALLRAIAWFKTVNPVLLGEIYGEIHGNDWIPSGKQPHNYGKSHHFEWENSLFQWPFSIAMLNYQSVIWGKTHGFNWFAWSCLISRIGTLRYGSKACEHQNG